MISTSQDTRTTRNNLNPAFISFGRKYEYALLIKRLIEVALGAELDSHLAQCAKPNRKNGRTCKAVKTTRGSFELYTPRDRANTFEPQFVKKHQIHLTLETETKILSMFCVGMSYPAIRTQLVEIYGSSLSAVDIEAVTEKVVHDVKQFQQRSLEGHYALVWLDVIRCKVKEEGGYVSKTIYTVWALDTNGVKDVLGLYIAKFENTHFWLGVLRDLQRRGLKDILIATVDGFTGFPGAMNSIYPNAKVQACPTLNLTGFKYLPHDDTMWNPGLITRYEFYVSLDNVEWKLMSQGEFSNIKNNPVVQVKNFAAEKARYIKLRALQNTSANNRVGYAEIDVIIQ